MAEVDDSKDVGNESTQPMVSAQYLAADGIPIVFLPFHISPLMAQDLF